MLPLLRKKDKTAFCLGQEYGIWCLASNRKQGEDVKLSLVPLFPPSLGKDAYMLYHATFMFYLTEKSTKSL